MAKLEVLLLHDRTKVGGIFLIDKFGTTVTFLSALGKAAFDDAAEVNNPDASSLLKNGDTPTGTYSIHIESSGPGTVYADVNKYGSVGVIKLDPVSGEALLAKQNGRTGLLVHGGKPGGIDNKSLRRTNGCIRMMNAELQFLLSKITDLDLLSNDKTTTLSVIEVDGVPGGLLNSDTNGRAGEGDPPPGF